MMMLMIIQLNGMNIRLLKGYFNMVLYIIDKYRVIILMM